MLLRRGWTRNGRGRRKPRAMLLPIFPLVCSSCKEELAKLKVKQSCFENDTLSANGPSSRVTTRHPVAQPVCWSGAAVPGALHGAPWPGDRPTSPPVTRHQAASHCPWRADMMKSASGPLAASPCPFPLHQSRTFRKKKKRTAGRTLSYHVTLCQARKLGRMPLKSVSQSSFFQPHELN